MRPALRYIFTPLMLTWALVTVAQKDTIVKYMPSFKFNDGLYLSQEEFISNCPSISKDELYYDDGRHAVEVGMWRPVYTLVGDTLHLVESQSVWGFAQQGQVYVRHRNFYNRMIVIGTICLVSHAVEHADYDYTYQPTYGNSMSVRRETIEEYLIDLRSGEKFPMKVDALSDLMIDDPTLYNDFNAITQKSKRKSRMYLFLRRYNDAHPVYFPITGCEVVSAGVEK